MTRLRTAVALLTTVLLGAGLAGPAAASPRPAPGSAPAGADISWPNCPTGMGIPQRRTLGLPMPTADARFVIVGLTNGPGFTPNPCLAAQVAWVKARHLWLGAYSITTYPNAAELAKYGGAGTATQRLQRVGRAQAAFNVKNMRAAGLRAPMVWVDVEPSTVRPWSASPASNNAVIDGIVAGYRAAGIAVGFYSYAYGWKEITGGRKWPSVPVWVPSGSNTRASAVNKCASSFSGGPVWFGQWTVANRDHNVACAGVTGTAGQLHPLTKYRTTVVKRGSRGAAVVALQKALKVSADGAFGPVTHGAVVRFQRAKRLAGTGVVTAATWRALGAGTAVGGRPSLFPRTFAST
ncbi:MAG: hypothetical protein JWN87_74 [Frankiales bacterium]|nr:hypothetical protein [Frankiales bacterium]